MFFFFSSRRRHTRWTGDWSSDVCSSDLRRCAALAGPRSAHDAVVKVDDPVAEPALVLQVEPQPDVAGQRLLAAPYQHRADDQVDLVDQARPDRLGGEDGT